MVFRESGVKSFFSLSDQYFFTPFSILLKKTWFFCTLWSIIFTCGFVLRIIYWAVAASGYHQRDEIAYLGRVSYALEQHNGHVVTNNLIRVVIEDENLRGYVYQFLRSEIGQSLMLKNAYGTNQEHLEPDVISDVLIPIPKDRRIIDEIGSRVISSIASIEQSIVSANEARELWKSIIS